MNGIRNGAGPRRKTDCCDEENLARILELDYSPEERAKKLAEWNLEQQAEVLKYMGPKERAEALEAMGPQERAEAY